MEFYELLFEFNKANSAKEIFDTYIQNYKECERHQLEVISCDKDIALNLPILKDIMDIPNIITIFKYPNLSFLNSTIVIDMINEKRTPLSIDYSISFESNTAKYLHEYLTKEKTNKVFIDTLHTFLDKNYNLDPMFYIIENVAKENNSQGFHNNLISIKKLMTCDIEHYKATKQIKSVFSDEEIELISKREIEYIKDEFKGVIYAAREQHLIMQIILLIITIARFKYTDNKEKEKLQFEYLIKFMSEKLKTIFLRELTIALDYLYFENNRNKLFKGSDEKEKYTFFNKLNTENKDTLFKSIQNMAWDFTLIRQLEIYFSSKPNAKADFFIPFLFTFDTGLLEIMKIFHVKNFLIFHKEKRTIPISINNLNMSKIKEYNLEKYFTEPALVSRLHSEDVDLKKIYEELKLEIIRVRKLK